jgi:hypothetical protein
MEAEEAPASPSAASSSPRPSRRARRPPASPSPHPSASAGVRASSSRGAPGRGGREGAPGSATERPLRRPLLLPCGRTLEASTRRCPCILEQPCLRTWSSARRRLGSCSPSSPRIPPTNPRRATPQSSPRHPKSSRRPPWGRGACSSTPARVVDCRRPAGEKRGLEVGEKLRPEIHALPCFSSHRRPGRRVAPPLLLRGCWGQGRATEGGRSASVLPSRPARSGRPQFAAGVELRRRAASPRCCFKSPPGPAATWTELGPLSSFERRRRDSSRRG